MKYLLGIFLLVLGGFGAAVTNDHFQYAASTPEFEYGELVQVIESSIPFRVIGLPQQFAYFMGLFWLMLAGSYVLGAFAAYFQFERVKPILMGSVFFGVLFFALLLPSQFAVTGLILNAVLAAFLALEHKFHWVFG